MQPVVRALRALTAISEQNLGITLQELSTRLDLPLASVHRILAVLSAEQFIVRSKATKRYFIGPAARVLFDDGRIPRTPRVVHPALGRLSAETGETAFLTEFMDGRALCVSLAEGRHPLRLFVRTGQELPLHAAASARVLLSEMPSTTVRRIMAAIPLTAFTPETPTSVEDVIARLPQIRKKGYDICNDELDRAVWAVAAPVRDDTGSICAALTVAAPAARVDSPILQRRCTDAVLSAAGRMSADMGQHG